MKDIDQIALDQPLGHLRLANGHRYAIKRETLRACRLRQRAAADPGDTDIQIQYLQLVVPDANEDELLDLNGPTIDEVVRRAMWGIESLEDLLGESSGARTASPSSDSPPGTATPSSATAMPLATV